MQDEPTPEELTKAVADFLRNDITPQISGHHAFKLRETLSLPKLDRAILQGHGPEPQSKESEGQMLERVCPELLGRRNVIVL